MSPERILVVAGESSTRRDLREILISQMYVVIEARTNEEALEEIETGRIDLTLIDVNLPGIDGFETCKRIREASDTPIILLLGPLSNEKDHVRALGTANDYLVRPFGSDQLIARMRSAFRAEPTETEKVKFESSNFLIDFACRRVVVNNRSIHLTPKELELLRHLVLNQGRPVSHVELLEALWGSSDPHYIGHLRVFVNQLRKKIEPHSKGSRNSHIQTDNFVGYHFEPAPGSQRTPADRTNKVKL